MPSIEQLLRRMRRNLFLYGDESGDLYSAPYFLLGLIRCRDPNRHELAMQRFRSKHQYHPELKYSSTDRHKVPFAESAIDYFFGETDLRFSAVVIDNLQHDLDHFRGGRPHPGDSAYAYWYKKLILSCTPRKDDLIIHLDDRSRRKEDDLPGYLAREIPNMSNLQLVDSSRHDLIQLADLLTGSVFGEAIGNNHPVKRDLIRRIRSRAMVSHLLAKELGHNSKFSVDVWKPPRSG